MIVSRAPVRFSLGGGGTDLPSYSREHGGFVVAASVDKFVFVCVARRFQKTFRLAYSESEIVDSIDQIKHRIFREALRMSAISCGLELHSLADVPANTGLGSSSSFTVALLNGLHAFKREFVPADQLAREASHLEIDVLKEPIGKQDQYIAAYGGITCFRFMPDGRVEAWPLKISEETLFNLEDNLLLFFTGFSRSASSILKEQKTKTLESDKAMVENLHFIKDLGKQSQKALESGDLRGFGRLMDVHWQRKKERSAGMSNSQINEWYDHAIANGALGGKLIGAGGGGFLMFYAEDKTKLRHAMREKGLSEVRFRFDFEGTKIVIQS
jgi:D-glycero-alpha-D-manno-heptose-7-phosphate kinase